MIVDREYQLIWIKFMSALRNMALTEEESKEKTESKDDQRVEKTPLIDIQNSDSSVFLTPPLSSEITRAQSRLLGSETSIPTLNYDDIIDDIRIDFVSRLSERSLEVTVGDKIFYQLTDIDLLRTSHVNRTWRDVVLRKNLVTGRRLRRFILQKKRSYKQKGKENTSHHSPLSRAIRPLPLGGRQETPRSSRVAEASKFSQTGSESNHCIPDGPLINLDSRSPSLTTKQTVSILEPPVLLKQRTSSLSSIGSTDESSSSRDCLMGSKASKKRLKRLSVS